MTFAIRDVFGGIEVISLAVLGYALIKPGRFTSSQFDAGRVAASTALILTGALHLALRFHLIV